MRILPIYAAILAIMFILLSIRTIMLRRKHKIAVGHGENTELLRAIRAHANFAEYVPLTLLLIYLLEVSTTSSLFIHALCLTLVIGRGIHAYSVSQVAENIQHRVIGMAMTFTVLGTAAISLLTISALNAFS